MKLKERFRGRRKGILLARVETSDSGMPMNKGQYEGVGKKTINQITMKYSSGDRK